MADLLDAVHESKLRFTRTEGLGQVGMAAEGATRVVVRSTRRMLRTTHGASAVHVAEQPVRNDEDDYGRKESATEFPGDEASETSTPYVVHLALHGTENGAQGVEKVVEDRI